MEKIKFLICKYRYQNLILPQDLVKTSVRGDYIHAPFAGISEFYGQYDVPINKSIIDSTKIIIPNKTYPENHFPVIAFKMARGVEYPSRRLVQEREKSLKMEKEIEDLKRKNEFLDKTRDTLYESTK